MSIKTKPYHFARLYSEGPLIVETNNGRGYDSEEKARLEADRFHDADEEAPLAIVKIVSVLRTQKIWTEE